MKKFNLHYWDGNPSFMKDYSELLTKTYSIFFSEEYMKWKHLYNPLGASIITFATNSSGHVIAARAFWKMYNDEYPVYQPCDTVTIPEYQKLGIFSALTNMCLDIIEDDSLVLNFPNNSSYMGYIKLGWKLLCDNRRLYAFGSFKKEINDISSYLFNKVPEKKRNYFIWRFLHNPMNMHYKFYHSEDCIIIDNGKHKGFFNINNKNLGYVTSGFSSGYILAIDCKYKFNFRSFLFYLKSNSRVVYFSKVHSDYDAYSYISNFSQVNILMDTF